MELKAHLSIPQSPIGNLIIIHENRGLDDHIRDVSNRFAEHGFAVAAPDYLSPIGGSVPNIETNITKIKNISQEDATDVTSYWSNALSQLSKTQDISILGFCWGGGIVNYCATQLRWLDKAIVFYGMAPDLSLIKNIKATMQLHYAENDDRINAGNGEYHKALTTNGINFQNYVYSGAEHAFFNDTRFDRYHSEASEIAFKRVVDFLKT